MGMSREFEVAWEDPSFKAQIEWDHGAPFLHLHVNHFAPSVLKNMYKQLAVGKLCLKERGHTHLFTYNAHQNDQWRKFVEHMGFKKLFVYKDLDIYCTEV
jgi:hypothetical protein